MRNQPSQLIFVDPPSTKMVRLRAIPARDATACRFGHAHARRIAGLRCGDSIVDKAMDRNRFRPLDRDATRADPAATSSSSAVHKMKAARILKEKGAWFLFLPPYSPDLNPMKWLSPS